MTSHYNNIGYTSTLEKMTARRKEESTTPSEYFLLARDLAFFGIILLHLGAAILAIPTIVTHQAAGIAISYLVVIIIVGVIAPVLALLGFRDHIKCSMVTCALWWELGWTFSLFLVDLVIALLYAGVPHGSKTVLGLTLSQTLITVLYWFTLATFTTLHRKTFPEAPIWSYSVQSICWLRSPFPQSPTSPLTRRNISISRPYNTYVNGSKIDNGFVAPWDEEWVRQVDNKEGKEKRVLDAEANLVYLMGRYGVRASASLLPSTGPFARSKEDKKREKRRKYTTAQISKPLPVPPGRLRGEKRFEPIQVEPIHLQFPSPALDLHLGPPRAPGLVNARQRPPSPPPPPSMSTRVQRTHKVSASDSTYTYTLPPSMRAGGLSRNLTLPHRVPQGQQQPSPTPRAPKVRTKRTWEGETL